jgi:hypothetical protein
MKTGLDHLPDGKIGGKIIALAAISATNAGAVGLRHVADYNQGDIGHWRIDARQL